MTVRARIKTIKPYLAPIAISGVFLFIDQLFKYLARSNADFTYYLWKPWFGWEYFPNPGIAFSLPFPNTLLVILTPLIILVLLAVLTRQKNPPVHLVVGTMLVVFGAVSNLVDRVLFEVTLDYLRLVSGVINLADVMIVVGAIMLLVPKKKPRA